MILCLLGWSLPFLFQAKKLAVTTVSQLLDASEDVFQRAADDNDDALNM
jgi:hypothetical protein